MLLKLETCLIVLPEPNNNLIIVRGCVYRKVEFCHVVWIAISADNFGVQLVTLSPDREEGITSFIPHQGDPLSFENVNDQLIRPYVQVWSYYSFETLSEDVVFQKLLLIDILLFLFIVVINRFFYGMHGRLLVLANDEAGDAQVTLAGSFVWSLWVNKPQPNSVELVVCMAIDRAKTD